MTLLVGLALITLIMLTFGHGTTAAVGLWGMALAYIMVNPDANYTFASWLVGAGLTAFLIQLALNLGGDGKK